MGFVFRCATPVSRRTTDTDSLPRAFTLPGYAFMARAAGRRTRRPRPLRSTLPRYRSPEPRVAHTRSCTHPLYTRIGDDRGTHKGVIFKITFTQRLSQNPVATGMTPFAEGGIRTFSYEKRRKVSLVSGEGFEPPTSSFDTITRIHRLSQRSNTGFTRSSHLSYPDSMPTCVSGQAGRSWA